MKTAGRKPKPTALKVLTGNPGRRPMGEAAGEVHAKPKLPRPPDSLSKNAKKEWRRLGRELLELGLIANVDRNTFALYCQAWADWCEAQAEVQEKGMLVRSPNNYPMVNPFYTIARQAAKQMDTLLSEFGLSPASRTRVQPAPQKVQKNIGRFGVRGVK